MIIKSGILSQMLDKHTFSHQNDKIIFQKTQHTFFLNKET